MLNGDKKNFIISILIGTLILTLIICTFSIQKELNITKNYINLKNAMSEVVVKNQSGIFRPDISYLLQNDKILNDYEVNEVKNHFYNIITNIKENELKKVFEEKDFKNSTSGSTSSQDLETVIREKELFENSQDIINRINLKYEETEKNKRATIEKNLNCKINYLDKADKLMKLEVQTVEVMLQTSTLLARYDMCIKTEIN